MSEPGVPPRDLLATLHHPATIRLRCAAVTQAVADGRSSHFRLDRSRLDDAAQRVAATLRRLYPTGAIPLHSRWLQFQAGGVDRKSELDALLSGRSRAEQACAQVDLTVVSVLLDADPGALWRYRERPGTVDALALPAQTQGREQLLALLDRAAGGAAAAAEPVAPNAPNAPDAPGAAFTRSEGLAVASLRAFVGGAFSATPSDPLRADGAALRLVDAAALRLLFQASAGNPLVGLEGRAGLLARLGSALLADATRGDRPARPGLLIDLLSADGTRKDLPAAEMLQMLLRLLAPIWQTGNVVKGVPAGDCWPHRFAGAAGGDPATAGWVPFHQLGHWLALSLVAPLAWAGLQVTGLDTLAGLPGADTGGLMLDSGVIVPRHAGDLARRWKPGDEFVVEWRALTVTLQDELAGRVRVLLGLTADELPLAGVLTGCVAASRELAAERRPGGAPPLLIDGDGTLF